MLPNIGDHSLPFQLSINQWVKIEPFLPQKYPNAFQRNNKKNTVDSFAIDFRNYVIFQKHKLRLSTCPKRIFAYLRKDTMLCIITKYLWDTYDINTFPQYCPSCIYQWFIKHLLGWYPTEETKKAANQKKQSKFLRTIWNS